MTGAKTSVGFWSTAGGRLSIAMAGLSFLGAGAVAVWGEEASSLVIPTLPPIVAIAYIVAVGLSLEDHPWHAFGLISVLPPLGGVYLFGLDMLERAGLRTFGWVLLAAGVVTFVAAFRRGAPAARPSASASSQPAG